MCCDAQKWDTVAGDDWGLVNEIVGKDETIRR